MSAALLNDGLSYALNGRAAEGVLITDAIKSTRILSLLSAVTRNPNRLIDKHRRLRGGGRGGSGMAVVQKWQLACQSGAHESSVSAWLKDTAL